MSGIEQHYRIDEIDGIRVVTERVPSVSSVSIGAWIAVGSRDEQDAERGYAHFLEHLLFKGNERWSATQINRWFDSIGSDANAATTKEYTVVHARVLDRHVPDALGVIGELVWHPAFRAEDVASEREVILEEIAMYADSPSDVVHELADELLYGEHGLGLPITGSAASIIAASPESMREFHTSRYQPASVVISAAGAVDHDQLLELVDTRFRGSRVGGVSAPSVPTRTAPGAHARVGSVSRDTEQVHVCLTWPGVARDDDRRFAAAVLDTVLGATPGSRLFAEVREERGLAYSVYSFGSQYADAGQLGIYLAVRPDRVTEAMTIIRQQIDLMRDRGITSEELDRAHRHLEGRTLLSMESTTVRGNRLGAALVTGMPIEPVATAIDRIRAVTCRDVQEIATSLLNNDKMCVAIVAEDASAAEEQVCSALGLADTPRVRVPIL